MRAINIMCFTHVSICPEKRACRPPVMPTVIVRRWWHSGRQRTSNTPRCRANQMSAMPSQPPAMLTCTAQLTIAVLVLCDHTRWLILRENAMNIQVLTSSYNEVSCPNRRIEIGFVIIVFKFVATTICVCVSLHACPSIARNCLAVT